MRIVTSDLFYCGEARAKLLKQQIMSLATLLTSVTKSLQMVTVAMKLKDTCSLEEKV